MQNYNAPRFINFITVSDISIKELAQTIQKVVGHEGAINWDATKPDGTPRKLLDVSKLNGLGWKAQVELEEGIKQTYDWFLQNQENFKEVKLWKRHSLPASPVKMALT